MTTSSCESRSSAEPQGHFKAADFDYDLPPERIAKYPLPDRGASRLLVMDRATGALQDKGVRELPDLLAPGDLLVLNDTRVIPARLFGRKPTGGEVEVLMERQLSRQRILAQLRFSRPPAPGSTLTLSEGMQVEVEGREGRFWILRFPQETDVADFLEQHGQVPLPPYIDRAPESQDRDRYQTVYAQNSGAVAAPTAGLHFDEALLHRLDEKGIGRIFVTLHVGAGTFQPIESEDIRDHRIHSERLSVSAEACARIEQARERGGRVIAVGTTSARALESAARSGRVQPFEGETRLYLYPGCTFVATDGLMTNFHLPRSSLLVMICAFAGRDATLHAYRHAVDCDYRFYSYGDAMLIL